MSAIVRDTIRHLADQIESVFPDHTRALKFELSDWIALDDNTYEERPRRLTESGWNRVADIICSLAALPGEELLESTRHLRLRALVLAESARAMARHVFGGVRGRGALELAEWMVTDPAAYVSPFST